MRISDWSSDVCSSDLGTLDLDLAERRCVEQADRIADREHLAANRGFLGFIPFPVPGGAEPASILFHLRTGGHLRSEEHTSELQSLMRISYAVFCLKKKTKHIAIV